MFIKVFNKTKGCEKFLENDLVFPREKKIFSQAQVELISRLRSLLSSFPCRSYLNEVQTFDLDSRRTFRKFHRFHRLFFHSLSSFSFFFFCLFLSSRCYRLTYRPRAFATSIPKNSNGRTLYKSFVIRNAWLNEKRFIARN